MLVSGVQQSDSVTYIHVSILYRFFCYIILNTVPFAIL